MPRGAVTTSDKYIHVGTGKSETGEIRTINIDAEKGIKALYNISTKEIVSYLFDKDKWDAVKAKEWTLKAIQEDVMIPLSEVEKLGKEFIKMRKKELFGI